jgi:hypothetical protein
MDPIMRKEVPATPRKAVGKNEFIEFFVWFGLNITYPGLSLGLYPLAFSFSLPLLITIILLLSLFRNNFAGIRNLYS